MGTSTPLKCINGHTHSPAPVKNVHTKHTDTNTHTRTHIHTHTHTHTHTQTHTHTCACVQCRSCPWPATAWKPSPHSWASSRASSAWASQATGCVGFQRPLGIFSIWRGSGCTGTCWRWVAFSKSAHLSCKGHLFSAVPALRTSLARAIHSLLRPQCAPLLQGPSILCCPRSAHLGSAHLNTLTMQSMVNLGQSAALADPV